MKIDNDIREIRDDVCGTCTQVKGARYILQGDALTNAQIAGARALSYIETRLDGIERNLDDILEQMQNNEPNRTNFDLVEFAACPICGEKHNVFETGLSHVIGYAFRCYTCGIMTTGHRDFDAARRAWNNLASKINALKGGRP